MQLPCDGNALSNKSLLWTLLFDPRKHRPNTQENDGAAITGRNRVSRQSMSLLWEQNLKFLQFTLNISALCIFCDLSLYCTDCVWRCSAASANYICSWFVPIECHKCILFITHCRVLFPSLVDSIPFFARICINDQDKLFILVLDALLC